MHPFTSLVLAALVLATATRLWLARRQIRHVAMHRSAVPAEFAETIDLAAHQKAADYVVAKTRLGQVEIAIGAALFLAFTLGGGIQALADAWSHVFAAGGYAHGIALLLSLAAIGAVIELPMDLYRVFVIEARFGFNRMTPILFVADTAKQIVLGLALGVPLLFVVLWLMAQMGSLWWLYVWLTWAGFNLLMVAIYPTLIAPIFNKFTPLADAALAARIENLLARCGFRARGLYVMDGSKRSSHGNAYFTGFGAAKRIVFFDTLIERLAPEEIEAVLAHELGHFKRRHVWKRMAWLAVASLAFLAALGYLAAEPWFYNALGVSSMTTATALALFSLVVPIFAFLLQPLASRASRKHEYEADAYAASHASAGDLVHALVKLYRDNAATLTPDPLHSVFYDSHPPAQLRIARLQSLAA